MKTPNMSLEEVVNLGAYSVTVVEFDTRMDMRRISMDGNRPDEYKAEEDSVGHHYYVRCVCCSKFPDDVPLLSYPEFMSLPGKLTTHWREVVQRINPDWFPYLTQDEEPKKNEDNVPPTSTAP